MSSGADYAGDASSNPSSSEVAPSGAAPVDTPRSGPANSGIAPSGVAYPDVASSAIASSEAALIEVVSLGVTPSDAAYVDGADSKAASSDITSFDIADVATAPAPADTPDSGPAYFDGASYDAAHSFVASSDTFSAGTAPAVTVPDASPRSSPANSDAAPSGAAYPDVASSRAASFAIASSDIAPEKPAADGPVEIVDDMGRTIRLAHPARRVVALYGAFNEMLAAMGREQCIVARTTADREPPSILAKPSIGTHMRPNVEMVVGLSPDLVLQMGGRAAATEPLRAIESHGIPTACFMVRDFDELFSVIRRLGVLTGAADGARQLETSMRARLDAVTQALTRSAPGSIQGVLPGGRPGSAQNMPLNVIQDVTRDFAQDVTQDFAQDYAQKPPDNAPPGLPSPVTSIDAYNDIPNAASDMASDAIPDTTSDSTQDARPGVASKPGFDSVPGHPLEATHNVTPDTAPDSTQGSATGMAPDSAPDSVANLAPDSAPNAEPAPAPGLSRPRVLFEIRGDNLLAAGQGSIVTDVIRRAGGANAVQLPRRVARLGEEEVLRLDPDYYVVQLGPMNRDPVPLPHRPRLAGLRCVRQGNHATVDEALFSRPGPRSVLAVEQLARLLHPEAFHRDAQAPEDTSPHAGETDGETRKAPAVAPVLDVKFQKVVHSPLICIGWDYQVTTSKPTTSEHASKCQTYSPWSSGIGTSHRGGSHPQCRGHGTGGEPPDGLQVA